MLKNFYQWYIEKIQKNPLIIIAGTIIALFGAMATVYSGIQALNNFSGLIRARYFESQISEDQILYDKLEKINTGLNIDFVESIIGGPAIIKELPDELVEYVKNKDGKWIEKKSASGLNMYTERIYVHEKYFLQVILNKEESTVLYAITIRDQNFNPKVPIEIYHGDKSGKTYPYIFNLRLGKMKLADLKDYEPERINIGNWGMHNFYVESNYFGNPGFYKHYLFGLSDLGCWVEGSNTISYEITDLLKDIDEPISNQKFAEWRQGLKPNTFGVIDGWENETLLEYLIREGVGVNYYDIREFD